jgi:catechol 2,3-dioxygenase-like lactoylglutathione lyase family enzyme
VARIGNITFACENPRALAEFWAAVLGYEIEQFPQEFVDTLRAHGVGEAELENEVAARDPTGSGPRLYFQRKEKTRTATAPIHLDINVEDHEAELQRLLGLGATLVETRTRRVGPISETWTVMRDPEGNPFCLQGGL